MRSACYCYMSCVARDAQWPSHLAQDVENMNARPPHQDRRRQKKPSCRKLAASVGNASRPSPLTSMLATSQPVNVTSIALNIEVWGERGGACMPLLRSMGATTTIFFAAYCLRLGLVRGLWQLGVKLFLPTTVLHPWHLRSSTWPVRGR